MSHHWLIPDWEPGLSLPHLSHKHLLDREIKAIVLDVDRTILPGKDLILHDSIKEWVNKARKDLTLHLLSNNPSKKRIENVANQLELTFTSGAAKPRRGALLKVLNQLDQKPTSTAIIGDRIFTDVLVGNRLGLYTVLVLPLGKDGKPSRNDNLQRIEKMLASFLGVRKR